MALREKHITRFVLEVSTILPLTGDEELNAAMRAIETILGRAGTTVKVLGLAAVQIEGGGGSGR